MNQNYSVLYAEDEDSIRKRYRSVLSNYFKNVYEATNGQEAHDIYIQNKPDVLIIDINMPILNGLELAKKIRKNDKTTKIIILSALGDQNTLLEACELNLLKYLIKPVKTFYLNQILTNSINELKNKDLIIIDQNIKLDIKDIILYDNEQQIKLTRNEINLISLLSKNINNIVSNDDILNYLWEDDIYTNSDANKLRVLVYRLNKKLSSEMISSIYGIGYQIITK